MTKAYFVAGTDTGIGKTVVTCALLRAWRRQGRVAVGYKPVAAGGESSERGLVNEDAQQILAASSPGFTLDDINPLCLKEAIAPHIAAEREGKCISMKDIATGFKALTDRCERMVVEGVGGLLVPLGDCGDASEIPRILNLPVILVVGMRLGCLNHALLTVEAIAARGLHLAAWVANCPQPEMPCLAENVAALRHRIHAPMLGVLPYMEDPFAAAAQLDLTLPAE